VFFEPPFSSFSEIAGATVTLTGGAEAPDLILTLPANPAAGEQVDEFEKTAGGQALPG
jgi:hypothetical protein